MSLRVAQGKFQRHPAFTRSGLRVLVCGDRNWADRYGLEHALEEVEMASGFISALIHGGAKGADTMAGEWAEHLLIPVLVFPADWQKYGKAAGPRRNALMLDEGKPDLVVAFHDDLDKSKGTKDMVRQARNIGVQCVVFSH